MPEYFDIMAFLPEIFLAVMAPVFLFLGVWQKQASGGQLAGLASGIAFIVFMLLAGGIHSGDIGSRFALLSCLAAMAIFVLLPYDAPDGEEIRPEYPGLVLFSLLGALFMVRAQYGLLLVAGMALAGMPGMFMALIHSRSGGRREAFRLSGILYVGMGLAVAFTLFGFMLLHASSGSLSFRQLDGFAIPTKILLAGAGFVVAGLVVFCATVFSHGWAIMTMFAGSGAHIMLAALLLPMAGFGSLFVLLHGPLGWSLPAMAMPLRMIGALSVLVAGGSILVGRQGRLYRILAGAMMAEGGLGVVAIVSMKVWAISLHAGIYLLAMAGLSGMLLGLRREGTKIDDLASLHGLGGRNPGWAAILLFFAGCLSFLPPFPGFAVLYALIGNIPEMQVRILLAAGVFLLAVGFMRAFSGVFAQGLDDRSGGRAEAFSLPGPVRFMALIAAGGLLSVLVMPHIFLLP